ncbi:MAG: peptide chain release factor N(5)-glutamine methyltransferase [Proteobacteria bacterium]|nr:peptide chain release factor N(5)-glutamine methyltransferase [Pseudomonadota bacterium]
MATTSAAIRAAAARLSAAGIENPRLEARLLLAHALGVRTEDLLRDPAAPVDPSRFDALVARRAGREPLAFILGRREFWSLDFAVAPDTLIPRPDSETLIEAALAAFPHRGAVRRVLDLGTGTGCLLLAALHEFPAAFGVGVDRAPGAAALARRNAAALGMADRAAFLCGDWAAALAGRFDLVLCNPPYIPAADVPGLMPEVARHEPASALAGGADGLDAYRAILPALTGLLAPGGAAVLEVGQGQAAPVAALAGAAGLAASPCADLAGIDRAVLLRAAPSRAGGQAAWACNPAS